VSVAGFLHRADTLKDWRPNNPVAASADQFGRDSPAFIHACCSTHERGLPFGQDGRVT